MQTNRPQYRLPPHLHRRFLHRRYHFHRLRLGLPRPRRLLGLHPLFLGPHLRPRGESLVFAREESRYSRHRMGLYFVVFGI